jgi:hypothetical protein
MTGFMNTFLSEFRTSLILQKLVGWGLSVEVMEFLSLELTRAPALISGLK